MWLVVLALLLLADCEWLTLSALLGAVLIYGGPLFIKILEVQCDE